MSHVEAVTDRQRTIRAILFDLHHTLTKTRVGFPGLTREAARDAGIDLSHISDAQLREATTKTDIFISDYQIGNNVDIHWGTKPEQWLEPNRTFLRNLGLDDYDDQRLIEFERAWKRITKSDWEMPADHAIDVLTKLCERGYILGICTRRHDDPSELLQRWEIDRLLSIVLWTAVPGYAKPSPFTLLQAAHEIRINPRLCAYVGNMVDADIRAAKNAEMLPILTTWANPDEKDKATDDTIIIDTLSDLLDVFSSPSKSPSQYS